jgi:hypothetical protein
VLIAEARGLGGCWDHALIIEQGGGELSQRDAKEPSWSVTDHASS